MRLVRAIKPWWVIVGFLTGFLLAMWAEEMRLHWQNDHIRISAPKLHFLAGRPLEKLRNGAAVNYDVALSLWVGSRNRMPRKALERFTMSYDLWEEKFSVVRAQNPSKRVSNLGAPAAETWCIDQMTVSASGIAPDTQLWARLEVRASEARDRRILGRDNISESGISLTSLVELFSRPAQSHQSTWTVETGPVTLNDLRRTIARKT